LNEGNFKGEEFVVSIRYPQTEEGNNNQLTRCSC